jgi:hypothetical protein
MTTFRWLLVTLVVIVVSACEFSGTVTSVQISAVKLTKDKEGKIETTTFAPSDKEVYARAHVSNVPSDGITLRFRVFADGVQGAPQGSVLLETFLELSTDDNVTFTMTAPDAGWPPGKYRIEISRLLAAEGKTKAAFTVPQ